MLPISLLSLRGTPHLKPYFVFVCLLLSQAAKLQFDVVFVDENLSINDGLYGHELVQVC